jgi:hypothetical protein
MYTFRGTYDGPVEFFRGRPIRASAIWTSEADVVEIADVEEHARSSHGVVEGWNRRDVPSAIDVDASTEEP